MTLRIASLHPAKWHAAGGIPPEVTMPLEQVQIDHTVIDLIVATSETGNRLAAL